jgi:hypothetical protein
MDDNSRKPEGCLVCEAMLPDAVDGTLNEAEQQAFDKHVASCVACANELAEAQRGAAWLHMLKGHTPEPSALLLAKILAQTTGAVNNVVSISATEARPAVSNVVRMPANLPEIAPVRAAAKLDAARLDAAKPAGVLVAFKRKIASAFTLDASRLHFQPRMAMTAAMAFFSVALTLNMTGVKITNLKLADLSPSSLRRAMADTSASASRSFHNLRVVNQFESKLEDFQTINREDETSRSSASRTRPSESDPVQQKQAPDSKDNKNEPSQPPKGHSSVEIPATDDNMPIREGM